jgi:hypothetical protein
MRQEVVMTIGFCQNCGHALVEGSHFCGECGAGVEVPATPTAPTTPAAPAAPLPPPAPSAPRKRPAWLLPVIAGGVAAVAIVAAVVVLTQDDEPKQAAAGEIFLEEATSTGRDPFTPSVDTNTAPPPVILEPVAVTAATTTLAPSTLAPTTLTPTPVPSSVAPTTLAPTTLAPTTSVAVPTTVAGLPVRTVNGAAPGLYGGTQNNAACDPEQMISFLMASPDKALAWAGVQGIGPADIPTYVRSLTPVVLRADTRVTNHGFANGVATSNPSILQRGTAVLVDQFGIPRARCSCGNPLTPPIPITTSPTYVGDPWPGFDPSAVVVVTNVTNVVVNNFVVVDLNGGYFGRRPPKATPTGVVTDGPIYIDSLCDLFPQAPECLPPTTTTTTTTLPSSSSTLAEPVLGTGDIQFTLRWSSTADLDLAVIDPDGEEIYYGSRTSSSGGQLDVDSNALCSEAVPNPVENIFWPTGQSIDGTYTVAVSYFNECGQGTGPQAFRLTALINGVPVTLTPVQASLRQQVGDQLSGQGDRKVYSVTKTPVPPVTTVAPTTTLTPPATQTSSAPTSRPPTENVPASSIAPVGSPPPTAEPGEPIDLATYCAEMYPPPEIGPQNPWYTLCMHDPTVS